MYAGMHDMFPLRKFQLCANVVAPGKLSHSKNISPITCWLALQLAKYPLALSQLAFYPRPALDPKYMPVSNKL